MQGVSNFVNEPQKKKKDKNNIQFVKACEFLNVQKIKIKYIKHLI